MKHQQALRATLCHLQAILHRRQAQPVSLCDIRASMSRTLQVRPAQAKRRRTLAHALQTKG